MKLNFIWKRKTGQYQSGESLYLNNICVGGYYWNSARLQGSQDKSTNWVGVIDLPSLKVKTVYADTEGNIKNKLEQIVTAWFTEALKEKALRQGGLL